MLLSMTGFGEASRSDTQRSVSVEVRTVNSRHFKLSLRTPEGYGALESEIEKLVREQVRRGTVQVNVRVDRQPRAEDYRLNATALESYRKQLQQLYERWHISESVLLENLLELPGVVDENASSAPDLEEELTFISAALAEALEALTAMRRQEGQAMAKDLTANCEEISGQLTAIEERAPAVSESFRTRLEERLQSILAERDINLEAADVIREVSIFAERADISEETVRLRSHLDQFHKAMQTDESAGRKLEFVLQEMFRETNTIGSKANDVQISQHVIEIKAAIERIREMVQNVE